MASNLSPTVEEYDLMSDPKYRSYVTAVDKTLKHFESTSEWADLISALGKLNKVLTSHADRPVIPRRILISKRLAQCMHPALPGGVHLKALETYDIIFRCIGIARLSRELFIYSAGLFPLLTNAAMNVRPALLNIYEIHFVPLGERLRPGLPGFLNGVLPGLEEGSEYFEKTNLVLEKVCLGVGNECFYGCLWECVLANPCVRLSAVTYVTNHFNRKLSTEDQLYVIGTNVDTMVKALSSAVVDTSVLVQRCTLDFILVAFPFHSGYLIRKDMERILTSAVSVVLRRDMSLNRRLYSWLLGGDEQHAVPDRPPRIVRLISDDSTTEISSNSYFEIHSKDVLVSALFSCLQSSHSNSFGEQNSASHLRPYRLLISLLDKPEIGQVILDDILLDVFRALYTECGGGLTVKTKEDRKGHKAEIFKTANLLFGTLEPHYIWEYLGEHFQECAANSTATKTDVKTDICVRFVGSGNTNVLELCVLTEFMLELISVETYVEMQVEHLPLLLSRLARILSSWCQSLSVEEITRILMLCTKLLSKIQLPIGPIASSSYGLPNKVDEPVVTVSDIINPSLTKVSAVQAYFTELSDNVMIEEKQEDVKDDGDEEEDMKSSHSVVLLTCISSFQECFVRLCTAHLLAPDVSLQDAMENLQVPKTEGPAERSVRLEKLLHNVLIEQKYNQRVNADNLLKDHVKSVNWKTITEFRLSSDAVHFIDAFRLCCQILVDFSSLPTCFAVGGGATTRHNRHTKTNNNLPDWLRLLLVVSCFVWKHVDLQLIAIGTVLELVGLSYSTQKTSYGNSGYQSPRSFGKGTFSVVIVPMLEARHMDFIHSQTLFTHTVTHILWNQIGACEAGCLQRCVELLHQLHNLALDGNTVEDVISESMSNEDETARLQAVRKFAIMWHVTRDLPPRSSSSLLLGRERLLDRPLLIMLDCLNGNSRPHQGTQHCEVLSWLTHSLQRGDIGPILEPLLIILLHPDTARVSVQHVSVESHQSRHRVTNCSSPAPQNNSDCRDQDRLDAVAESKIYAISSVEGQVIYHVAGSGKSSSSNNATGPWSTSISQSKPVFALSSIEPEGNWRDRIVTSNANLSDFDLPSICERNSLISDPICVFVNPFVVDATTANSSMNHCDSGVTTTSHCNVDLSQAHRIDVAALRMSSGSSEESVVDDPTTSDAVASVVDEILDGVFSGDDDDSNSLTTKTQDPESMDNGINVLPHRPAPPPPLPSNRNSDATMTIKEKDVSIHALHTYMLLYTQCYDSRRVLYALRTLKGIVIANARLAVCAMTTTGISNSRCRRQLLLYELLARHRRSIFGRGFQGEVGADVATGFRSSMYLEVIITICLYYMRAFYPNLAHMNLTNDDLADNWEVQLLSVELLTVLFTEVAAVVRDSGKGFASYISNLLAKCKVQKAVLHCVLSGIQRIDPLTNRAPVDTSSETFTEAIIRFNEAAAAAASNSTADSQQRGCDFQETFQIAALRLLLVLVIMEDQLANHKVDLDTKVDEPSASRSGTPTPQQASLRYHTGVLIPCQPLFQSALKTALGQPHSSPLHRHWLGLVSCLLPFMRKALANTVVSTVSQLCSNLEILAGLYSVDNKSSKSDTGENTFKTTFPVDHLVLQLEGMTTLVHYCLLDSSNLVSTVQFSPQPSSMAGSAYNNGLVSAGPNATQIISNLINVFAPSVVRGRDASSSVTSSPARFDPLAIARHNVLSLLPRLVSSLATLWMAVSSTSNCNGNSVDQDNKWSQNQQQQQVASWVMGMPKVVQKHILDLLCPLSLHHGVNFLASLALAWNEKRNGMGRGQLQLQQQNNTKKVIPTCSSEQLSLVELVRAIKVMPMESVIQLVRQVVKQPPVSPPASMLDKKRGRTTPSIEVLVLQFFHAYVQCSPGVHLVESWNSLQALLKDCLQTSNFGPPALFYLFGILNEFVQRAPPLEDRKDQKDLQDLTQKLVESCGSVAGASLENTTWLRRNLAVKPGPQTDINELDTCNGGGRRSGSASPIELRGYGHEEHRWASEGNLAEMTSTKSFGSSGNNSSNYSVQALSILAEMLAPLLDVVYHSDEKERVLPILAALMYNVTPYLRTHGAHNMPSFRACSSLLASISGYQYTRRAWRRDVFDLLLDPAFFQMEQGCLRSWRTIVDNLMTHDKTTFLDLMARVSIAQSGSLNLFSSKEQEYEQRAQLLKRLAFVIFCSEVDQYQSYMPEIQERLAESMRLQQVPNVQAMVFLCFRVLLLRMIPQHITSLWPVIITEMVQVFLLVEQELCKNSDAFRHNSVSSHLRRLSTLETSLVNAGVNELNAHNHPAWLQLYLAVCKLLDLCLCLPADALPQFQMYSWAFIGRSTEGGLGNQRHPSGMPPTAEGFVPHVVRLANLMSTKEPCSNKLPHQPGTPLLTIRQVRTLYDLQPFFETVSTMCGGINGNDNDNGNVNNGYRELERRDSRKNCERTESVASIEKQLELDFLESLPSSL